MLHDDFPDHNWFFGFADISAENAAQAVIDCSATFEGLKIAMSGGPTEFKNDIVRSVSNGLKVSHHITMPYCL